MNDMSVTDIPAGTVNLSTTLEPGSYSTEQGQGRPSLGANEGTDKPETLEAALADELKKMDDGAAKPEPVAKVVKPEPKQEKPAKAEQEDKATSEPETEETKTVAEKPVKPEVEKPQGKQIEPPHRFLAPAKEVWANTPNPVKAEVARLVADHEAEVSQYAESKRFHEDLKDYDGMAKQAGTSVKGALDRYVAFDRQLSQDFGTGVRAIAQDQGKQPQEVIAHVLRAYGVTPQQYAQIVTQNPQAHQPIAQRQQPAAPQPNAEVAQLRQQVQDMERRQGERQIEAEVLAPFMADHPRFVELQDDIAMFLKSGKVPTNGLGHAERLEIAYELADRINPAPYRGIPAPPAPDLGTIDAGKKSVRGAPSDGLIPATAETNEPLDEWLRKEMRKMKS